MAINDYSSTPALNTSIGGIDIDEGCPAPNLNNALRQLMADLKDFVPSGEFDTGTVMLFAQTAAPTGWTKQTTHDNKALRVVSGTAGSGGSVAFTTAFTGAVAVTGTTDSHILSVAEMPAHFHGSSIGDNETSAIARGTQALGTPTSNNMTVSSAAGTIEAKSETIGGGGGHTHDFTGGVNLAVQYVDIILAAKA